MKLWQAFVHWYQQCLSGVLFKRGKADQIHMCICTYSVRLTSSVIISNADGLPHVELGEGRDLSWNPVPRKLVKHASFFTVVSAHSWMPYPPDSTPNPYDLYAMVLPLEVCLIGDRILVGKTCLFGLEHKDWAQGTWFLADLQICSTFSSEWYPCCSFGFWPSKSYFPGT